MGGRELGRLLQGGRPGSGSWGPSQRPSPEHRAPSRGWAVGPGEGPAQQRPWLGRAAGNWRPDPLRHHWAGMEGPGGLTWCHGLWAGQREPQKTGQGWAGPAEPQGPDRLCDVYSPKSQMKFHFVKGLLMGARHKCLWGWKWTLKATIQKYELPKGSLVFFRAHHRDRTTPSSMVDSRRHAAYCAERWDGQSYTGKHWASGKLLWNYKDQEKVLRFHPKQFIFKIFFFLSGSLKHPIISTAYTWDISSALSESKYNVWDKHSEGKGSARSKTAYATSFFLLAHALWDIL